MKYSISFCFLVITLINNSVFAQNKISSSKKINYTKISTSNAKSLGFPIIKSSVINNQFSLSAKNNVAIRKQKKYPTKKQNSLPQTSNNRNNSLRTLKSNQVNLSNFNITSKTTNTTKSTLKNYKQTSIKYSKKVTPIFISSEFKGELSKYSKKSRRTIAFEYLEELQEILMINSPGEEFEIIEENNDKFGLSHIKFEQVFNNIPVYAKEIIVHLDKRGIVKSLNGSYVATPKGVSTNPKLNPKIIIDKLPKIFNKSLLELNKHNELIEPSLVIYEKNDQLFLSWYMTIYSSQLDRWNLFIDDNTGEVLDKIYTTCTISPDHNHNKKKPKISNKNIENKKLATGTGVDLNGIQRDLNTFFYNNTYMLIDITKSSYNSNVSSGIEQKGSITTTKYNISDENLYVASSNDNNFDDPSLVSAHYNASLVYDYFLETHDRTSIDGKAGTVISMTNLKNEDGDDEDNATWNGKWISYGNGRVYFKPFAGALDVAAHEFTHGVVEWTAALEYSDESGALNESFSDIFGLMVDRDDWTLGEDIVNIEYFPNGCLRSLEEPELGNQPSHYDDYVVGGGVHTNSGIPNRAFYIIASEMGKEKAEQIYYRALTTYLTRSSDFLDLRIGLEQSAIDIYGSNSPELTTIRQGLDSVGILFRQIEEEERIEVDGTDYILSYDTDPDNNTTFYLSDPFGDEFQPLSVTKIWSKPSISSDGFFLVFVTEDNNLNGMSLIENNIFEYTIDDTGVWNTVAISKDKSKIALTTVNEGDKNIYVYDLKNDKWGTFELYTPTTAQGGLKSDQIVYADALEWDNKSERIIFDQLNRIKRGDSEDLEYWDIGIMDVWNSEKNRFDNGNIIRLYSQIPENVNIGYPSFAKTTNSVITFDYIENIDGEQYSYVLLLDLETSEFGFFESNSLWSVPNFATLDNQIIYNQLDSNGISEVYSRQVEDIILPSDQETLLITYADWGLWLNQGERDFDKDGVLDDIDKCPNSPEGVKVDEDGCALSQKDTDKDDVYDDLDNCILEFNPDQIDTDGDGLGNVCDDDDDGDGILDENDECPTTKLEAIVDLKGCEIFNLPVDNFKIYVEEISCVGNDDGEIVLSANDKSFDYVASISNNLNDNTENIKDDDSVKLDLSNNHSANFKNLEPGNYDVCIKVVGQESFEQCFELTVKEPQPLAASTKVDNSDGLVQFNLRGSSTYYLKHNGESKIIEENNPIINLKPGLNTVEISTENNCQGIIIKEFFNSEEVEYYPNPTNGIVNFYIHGNDNYIEINTLDSRGNLIMNNSFNVPLSRKIQIDFSENIKGVYFVKINSENVKKTIKIIKE